MRFPRPTHDQYFLYLAFAVSTRSEDEDTAHGTIIVDNKTKHVSGCGFNALYRGANKENFDLSRPAKYQVMIHSEESAIFNTPRNPLYSSDGATAYVTGKNCNNCLQRLINFGINRIVCAKRQGTKLESKETDELYQKIINDSKIKIDFIDLKNIKFIHEKLGEYFN